jgi:ABC-type dipeptide/oligopeptide/nickel transport system permease component
VPIVTVVGIGIALLIGGVVVTESVFAIPGQEGRLGTHGLGTQWRILGSNRL